MILSHNEAAGLGLLVTIDDAVKSIQLELGEIPFLWRQC